MAKTKAPQYICAECGYISPRWSGKCSSCEAWNSFQEYVSADASKGGTGHSLRTAALGKADKNVKKRLASGFSSVDKLLGGGIVPDSALLITGEPGIGKSTLLLQLAGYMAKNNRVLYISGEESASQVAARAKRLKIDSGSIQFSDSSDVDNVAATIADKNFDLAIVDSIQTMQSKASASNPGGVAQVSLSGQILSRAAKQAGCALLIVGHVTKQGSIAGPKVLEHLVDVVLDLEGDRYGSFRMLRSRKNRFGPTDEMVVMDIGEKGLEDVDSPSKELLKERQIADGSVVLAALDGNQPLLVEVQALVAPTPFGYPKRTAAGFSLNRLNLLIAMLGRRTKLKLDDKDIYLNIVGGFKLQDPGSDLAVCMAIATASKGMQLKGDAAVFGEVGLSGEIRHVPGAAKRLKEAQALGFKRVIGPASAELKSAKYQGVKNIRNTLNTNLVK